MKKVCLILLFYSVALFAKTDFWNLLVDTQKQLFPDQTLYRLIDLTEVNQTTQNELNTTDSNIDARIDAYEKLIRILQKAPFSVEKAQNPFYDPQKSAKLRNKLILKIEANRKYGYLQAVKRDKLLLEDLNLREIIYRFFLYLADNWTRLDEKALRDYIQKRREALKKIPFQNAVSVYETARAQKGEIAAQTVQNFLQLARDYHFFESFLDYLYLNAKLLTYHSFASKLRLDNLIDRINETPIAARINTKLRLIDLDTGRVVLFFVVILFFFILNYLLYKKLYSWFKAKILEHEDETDELMLANLDRIRRPVSLLVNGFGLKLALEVVRYPVPLSENTERFFDILFIALIAYIFMIIIENIFFLYFYTKHERGTQTLRGELVNLMLSVTKAVIFVTALLVALVKMGVNVTGLVASLGIGGLAVALAAQDTLSNFFGLLKIIFDESFSQGDWIQTADVEGTVVEIGFISTKIRTFDNALITVPNAKLANTPLKNWNRRTYGRRIKMHIGVTYGASAEQLRKATDEIKTMLENHPDIITAEKIDHRIIRKRFKETGKFLSPEDKLGIKTTLLVFLDNFSASSIDILIYTFSKSTEWEKWLAVKEDIMYRIMEILQRNGLEFAFPSQTLYFDKENIAQSAEALKRLK